MSILDSDDDALSSDARTPGSGFLVAIYPANVYMWQNDLLSDGSVPSTTEHVLRLVFQIVLVAADLRWSC